MSKKCEEFLTQVIVVIFFSKFVELGIVKKGISTVNMHAKLIKIILVKLKKKNLNKLKIFD